MQEDHDFSTLPKGLCRRLLLGFSGKFHLHAIAAEALARSVRPDDVFAEIANHAFLTAWGENPFDGNCTAAYAGSMDKLPPMDASLLPAIKTIMNGWKPEITPEAQQAMAGRPEKQLAFLQARLDVAPDNFFWLHHLYEYCRINGQWESLVPYLKDTPPLGALYEYVRANCLLAAGDNAAASDAYARCRLALPTVAARRATALIRRGMAEQGEAALRRCVARQPWNVNLWMRLYDIVTGGVQKCLPLKGKTMVLGYSWNKGNDLAQTLDSLARSDIEHVHVRILNNGSGDATSEVIRQFIDTFGSDKVAGITMPVNIGAPAARNWLKSLPEVQNSEYTVYIDDDISLPKDWLHRLGAAVAEYPHAGVWGCKVVDYDGPSRVQCGEHNLAPTPEERQQMLMSTIMLQDGDFGQADYIRPCASVTGCVHLFRTKHLLETGDFDLRFSPTQYDDLERDLRMVLAGQYAVYTGHAAIPHKRTSGAMSDVGQPESAGATANMHKLMAKYTPQEFETMAACMDTVLLEDWQRKQAVIKQVTSG